MNPSDGNPAENRGNVEIDFIYSDFRERPVSGNQFYDRMLADTLADTCGATVLQQSIATGGEGNKKPSPFLSLRRGLRLAAGRAVFFDSADCGTLIPLALALRLKGKKVFTVHHHFAYRQHTGWKRIRKRLSENIFLRLASRIVIPSPYIHSEMLAAFSQDKLLLWKIPFERGVVEGQNPEPGRLAYVGTVESRKGLVYLIEAMRILKTRGLDCRLDVIGQETERDYADRLRERISEAGLDVTFHGFVGAETKHELLKRAEVFTFPSLLEGFGMVLAEAQRYKLPTVCFDNSAMPYTVKNGVNGLVCPDRDVKAMADAIEKILTKPGLRERLSLGAAASARHRFDIGDFRKAVARDMTALLSY